MFAVRFSVYGRVQGVGFRQFVKTEADRCGATGWVKNCRDGSVEGFAQTGVREALDALLHKIRVGPQQSSASGALVAPRASVERVAVHQSSPDQGCSNFSVLVTD